MARPITQPDMFPIFLGFHTFSLLWTSDEYVFYVDGPCPAEEESADEQGSKNMLELIWMGGVFASL